MGDRPKDGASDEDEPTHTGKYDKYVDRVLDLLGLI